MSDLVKFIWSFSLIFTFDFSHKKYFGQFSLYLHLIVAILARKRPDLVQQFESDISHLKKQRHSDTVTEDNENLRPSKKQKGEVEIINDENKIIGNEKSQFPKNKENDPKNKPQHKTEVTFDHEKMIITVAHDAAELVTTQTTENKEGKCISENKTKVIDETVPLLAEGEDFFVNVVDVSSLAEGQTKVTASPEKLKVQMDNIFEDAFDAADLVVMNEISFPSDDLKTEIESIAEYETFANEVTLETVSLHPQRVHTESGDIIEDVVETKVKDETFLFSKTEKKGGLSLAEGQTEVTASDCLPEKLNVQMDSISDNGADRKVNKKVEVTSNNKEREISNAENIQFISVPPIPECNLKAAGSAHPVTINDYLRRGISCKKNYIADDASISEDDSDKDETYKPEHTESESTTAEDSTMSNETKEKGESFLFSKTEKNGGLSLAEGQTEVTASDCLPEKLKVQMDSISDNGADRKVNKKVEVTSKNKEREISSAENTQFISVPEKPECNLKAAGSAHPVTINDYRRRGISCKKNYIADDASTSEDDSDKDETYKPEHTESESTTAEDSTMSETFDWSGYHQKRTRNMKKRYKHKNITSGKITFSSKVCAKKIVETHQALTSCDPFDTTEAVAQGTNDIALDLTENVSDSESNTSQIIAIPPNQMLKNLTILEKKVEESESEESEHDTFSEDNDESDSESPPDASEVTYDVKYQGIYIRKILKSMTTKLGKHKKCERVYNSRSTCPYCYKNCSNFSQHILSKLHENEPDVVKIKQITIEQQDDELTKKDKSKQRKIMISLLRNQGNNKHNQKVIERKKGEIFLARRSSSGNFNLAEYGPCPNCYEWLRLSIIDRHQSGCPAASGNITPTSKGSLLIQSDVLSGRISEDASKTLINEVYPIMQMDKIGMEARNDVLIIGLGNQWMTRNVGNKIMRKYYTSAVMRLAARLKLALNQMITPQNGTTLSDYLVPIYFTQVAKAALRVAKQDEGDEEDLAAPSNAVKLSYDIKRLVSIKLAKAIRSENTKDRQEAEDFLKLMSIEWSTKLARVTLEDRKHNKKTPLPLQEDIQRLSEYLNDQIREFKTQDASYKNYRSGVILAESKLITFNRRRCGELQAMR